MQLGRDRGLTSLCEDISDRGALEHERLLTTDHLGQEAGDQRVRARSAMSSESGTHDLVCCLWLGQRPDFDQVGFHLLWDGRDRAGFRISLTGPDGQAELDRPTDLGVELDGQLRDLRRPRRSRRRRRR
jgi:hypothetical protein